MLGFINDILANLLIKHPLKPLHIPAVLIQVVMNGLAIPRVHHYVLVVRYLDDRPRLTLVQLLLHIRQRLLIVCAHQHARLAVCILRLLLVGGIDEWI